MAKTQNSDVQQQVSDLVKIYTDAAAPVVMVRKLSARNLSRLQKSFYQSGVIHVSLDDFSRNDAQVWVDFFDGAAAMQKKKPLVIYTVNNPGAMTTLHAENLFVRPEIAKKAATQLRQQKD